MIIDYSQEEKAIDATTIFEMKVQWTWKGLKKSTSRIPVGLR